MAHNLDILDQKHTCNNTVPEKIKNSLIEGIHKMQVEYGQDPQMCCFKLYMPGNPYSVNADSDNEHEDHVNDPADDENNASVADSPKLMVLEH